MSWCSITSAPRAVVETAPPDTITVESQDGHRWQLLARVPPKPRKALLWLPALGIAARHYLPLADALAARGVAVFVHEWRGHGSSNLRANRGTDWGYRELLIHDIPSSQTAISHRLPGLAQVLGGHSLGGQLACCRAALDPDAVRQLWLVGSGAPYWQAFPLRSRYALALASRFLPWLAHRHGALPGRRIGFGGAEARSLMADWGRTAIDGRYAAAGLAVDLESVLASSSIPVRAILLERDWYAPAGSLGFLLSKMPLAEARVATLDEAALGTRADHFAWMSRPDRVAGQLLGQPPAAEPD